MEIKKQQKKKSADPSVLLDIRWNPDGKPTPAPPVSKFQKQRQARTFHRLLRLYLWQQSWEHNDPF